MKQLWIILIAICCSLSLFGQEHNSDTAHPKQSSGPKAVMTDSGRATRSMSGTKGKAPAGVNAGHSGKTDSGKLSTAAALNKQNRLKTDSAGDNQEPGQSRNAPVTQTGNGTSGDTAAPSALSPAEAAARKQQKEAEQLKALKDSIYKANRAVIRERLAKQAAINSANKPDYTLFFPDYFYQNNNNGSDSGALVHIHNYKDRDLLFSAFLVIALLLGLIKVIFPRYFNQVFWFFLHPNDRKNNIADQISGQNIVPSLLLNLFFVLTGGLFLTEILRPGIPGANFWSAWLLFTGLLTGVYLVKFLVILLSGWIFGAPTAATIYNQVVFSINKIIGLLLLPATLLISYGSGQALAHVLTAVLIIISILLIYRYIASFLLIKGKLKVSAFHFILYLCAVEIIPLLLVYKVLLTNIGSFM